MKRLARWSILASCAALILPTLAYAQDATTKLPQDIVYKSPIAGYPEMATVYGDTAKSGIYVQRVKFAPGFKIMPHWHPDEVRTVVVLSGTFYFGYGEKWDESKLKALPAGTFFTEPPRAPHFAWAKDGEVMLQITGVGPTSVTMVEQPKQ
jgi:quercetin dioxygenase-like cupin family protein